MDKYHMNKKHNNHLVWV